MCYREQGVSTRALLAMYLNLVLEELAKGTEITLRCMVTLLKNIEDAQRRERVEEHRVRQDFKP
jgi:hypothetical protein